MAPLYEEVCGELGVSGNAAALGEMRERNAKQLAELDEKIKDAGGSAAGARGVPAACGHRGIGRAVVSLPPTRSVAGHPPCAALLCHPHPTRTHPLGAEVNAGEMEVRDALQARADYLCGIGDHAAALEAFAAAEAKTAGVGPKMDLAFSQIRLELSRGDWGAVKAGLDKARGLCDKGGDWERKNKLKVGRAGGAHGARAGPGDRGTGQRSVWGVGRLALRGATWPQCRNPCAQPQSIPCGLRPCLRAAARCTRPCS